MNNVLYKLPLILEPQPEGGYTITCPLLPSLITEADTLEEVMPNVADALAALIEAYEDLKQPSDWERVDAMTDEEIDTSEIPPLDEDLASFSST